jgi:predicted dithiol-disulfide oxidoreductase (DUF899 family)
MQPHKIVSREEWTAARKAHLAHEKEFTRARDRLSAERRELPWVKVENNYVFDGPDGKATLADLFGGRSQLIVNHFMLGPGWKEGCIGCSFGADNVEGALVHLAQRDVAYVAVSRAPLAEIEAYRKRMGWDFKWVSSFGNGFNYDFHVSFRPEDMARGKVEYNYQMIDSSMDELPGHSVFARDDDGNIYHTYSSYGRGAEEEPAGLHPHGEDGGKGLARTRRQRIPRMGRRGRQGRKADLVPAQRQAEARRDGGVFLDRL